MALNFYINHQLIHLSYSSDYLLQNNILLDFPRLEMHKHYFQFTPVDPDTDSVITVLADNEELSSDENTKIEWRRILPNKNYVVLSNNLSTYQCTPLDKNCIIQAKISCQLYGNTISRSLNTKTIQPKQQLQGINNNNKMPTIQCIIVTDEMRNQMKITVEKDKFKLITHYGSLQLLIEQNTVEGDTDPNCFKINLQNSRDKFFNFFKSSLASSKPSSIFCVVNSKVERDFVLSIVADRYQIHPENRGYVPHSHLYHGHSDSSFKSNSKNKQRNLTKISEFSLKKSNHKPYIPTSLKGNGDDHKQESPSCSNKLLATDQCLNIFEEDDEFLNYGANQKNQEQVQSEIDLRSSFQQFEKSSTVQSKNEKFFPTTNSLQAQNQRLKQQNQRLRKQIESLGEPSKQISTLKKKYMTSIDQINRLQNQRRAILTDKVKFESKYHKQCQQRQLLLKQLQQYQTTK